MSVKGISFVVWKPHYLSELMPAEHTINKQDQSTQNNIAIQ